MALKYEIKRSKQQLHFINVKVGDIFCKTIDGTNHLYIKLCEVVESKSNCFDITGNRLVEFSCTDTVDSIYLGEVHFDTEMFGYGEH